ncbi:MAG: hypothetical protein AAGE76_08780 [Pseudomonadota bacterium]
MADLATSPEDALRALALDRYDALVLDPAMEDGGGLPVADFASFRNPDIAILAITRSAFFSEGALFDLIPNARGVLREPVRPDDLAAYMEHFSEKVEARQPARRA